MACSDILFAKHWELNEVIIISAVIYFRSVSQHCERSYLYPERFEKYIIMAVICIGKQAGFVYGVKLFVKLKKCKLNWLQPIENILIERLGSSFH